MAFFVTAVVAAADLGTVAAIATAVSEVGTALSVVGAVTGNATLTKVGAVMGLAGGAVGLADSAFSGTAAAASDADLSNGLSAGSGSTLDSSALGADLDSSSLTGTAAPSVSSGLGANLDSSALTGAGGVSGDVATGLGSGAADSGAIASSVPNLADGSADYGALDAAAPTASATDAGLGAGGTASAAPLGAPAAPSSLIDNAMNAPQAGDPSLTNTGLPASTSLQDTANNTYNSIAQPATGAPVASSPLVTPGASAAGASSGASPVASVTQAPTTANVVSNLNAGQVTSLGSSGQLAGAAPVAPADGMGSNASHMNLPGANAAASNSSNFFSGMMNAPSNFGGQLAMGALSGIGQAYQASKNYELGQDQLALAQQKQNNVSAQPTYAGIINNARKNANTGS